jgi:hypothetical protein
MLTSSAGSIVLYDLDLHYTEKYQRAWQNTRLAEASEIHIKWLKTRADDYQPYTYPFSVKMEHVIKIMYRNWNA